MSWALGIDVGTTGVKAAAVSVHGAIHAEAIRELETLRTADGGWEQDPRAMADAVLDVATEVVAAMADWGEDAPCVGIQCAGQWSSIVPVDATGAPLHNLLLWMDQRGSAETRRFLERQPGSIERFLGQHGLVPSPDGGTSFSRMLWLREQRPDTWGRVRACLEPADYAGMVLTGRIATSPCTAYPLLLTDNRQPQHSPWAAELLQLTRFDNAQLPDLLGKRDRLGHLLPDVAARIGLPADTPVFAGVNDTHAVQVGTGAVMPGQGGVSIGTTTVLACALDGFRADYEHLLLPMPSPFAEDWTVMAENGLGGRAIAVALEQLYGAADDATWAQFEADAQAVPPGSGGAIYLPFINGALAPRPSNHARAGFLNLHHGHDRRHLARAAQEGVALNLRWMFDAAEAFLGTPFNSITLGGGATQIEGFAQVVADVLQRPARLLEHPRAVACRGAGLLVFNRLGDLSREQIARIGSNAELFLPDVRQAATWQALQARFVALRDATEAEARHFAGLDLPLDYADGS